MKKNYQQSDRARTERDTLDHALDAALEKYAAVEPRAGLEQRVLSRLQSETRTIPIRSWWQWSTVGAVATLLVITAAWAWKSSRPAKSFAQQHPSAPIEIVSPSSTLAASGVPGPVRPPKARAVHTQPRRRHPPVVAADGPKLDQFPSPRPLSEEELALTRYVRQFPAEAIVIARAQEDFEKEMLQQEKDTLEGVSTDSERPER